MQGLCYNAGLMAKLITEVLKRHLSNKARVTRISTDHGVVLTPCFMPVGTRAFVNHMTPEDLVAAQSQLILGGNTYHMLVTPGMEVITMAGGMHRFMHWHGPMLTDSGGFQVFSLSRNKKICKIDEIGAHFKHPVSGKLIHLTPASSIETQKIIGADIIMAFDQCTPEEGGRIAAIDALTRTHRWLLESIEAHHQQAPRYGHDQALFGIIQGGSFRDLREQSAEFVLSQDLDGIAIGGEVIGGDMLATVEIISWVEPLIPENKTRYTMGVGLGPQDLFDVVAAGIDIFDCVAPTRNARHGALYCGHFETTEDGWIRFASTEEKGRILIKKAKYAQDQGPIMEGCGCYTCKHYTRSYLHFLFRENLSLYSQLACIHNVFVMNEACLRMRELILV